MCDQAGVEREAGTWASLWAAGGDYPALFGEDLAPPLQSLLAASIREAASTFQAGTGMGSDNVSPRAFARLPDDLLTALGSILHACERLGRGP